MPETIIRHLKILARETLNETLLDDLEVVNVICGKNNSGRSTLLNEIGDESQRKIGLRLTEHDAAAMADRAAQSMGWNAPYQTANAQALLDI